MKYYVYEWIRLDTNEPFYVGKGHGNRWKNLTRGNNNHFNNIVKTIPTAVNILHDNLDEETAFGLECWYINEYKYVIGYDLVNITDGGEGASGYHHTEEYKQRQSERYSGEGNPMYGKDWREGKTQEELEEHSRRLSELNKGENNPMYSKHHSEESKQLMSELAQGKYKGENNPFYGKTHTEENRIKMSKGRRGKLTGSKNPNAKKIICVETGEIFDTIIKASDKMDIKYSTLRSAVRRGKKTHGYMFIYYDEYLKQNEVA